MEPITGFILNLLFGLGTNLSSDYLLTAFKDGELKQLLEDEETRTALKAYRPITDDVRLICHQLADQHERLWVSPAQKQLRPLLRDPSFHADFVEWLKVGGIEKGEAAKERIIQKMDGLLAADTISAEQRQFLHQHFFAALEKAVFADEILSNWRIQLSINFFKQEVAEVRRLAEEGAGSFSEDRKSAALEAYCRYALDCCDIIDLGNLPNDRDIATQKLLLRQLYMPLRIRFEESTSVGHEQEVFQDFEQHRHIGRLRDAGRTGALHSTAVDTMGEPVAIGERLGAGQRFVVLGDPGGGKTTMLRWLATAYLLRHTQDQAIDQLPDAQTLPVEPWIPVLIRCRDLGMDDLCRSFQDVLEMHLKKELPDEAQVMVAVILERLAKGEILLLVDGLDEISDRQVRHKFCQQLEKTALHYPDAPILVTSRIVGYRDMASRMRSGFAHGVISDLDRDTKDLFARRWVEATEAHQSLADRGKSSQALIDALHSLDRIERLTNNPMLLTTMALVKRNVGKLPTRRNKLYAQAVSVLLNWNPGFYSVIEEEEALPQLAFLAYEMCRRGVQQLTGEDVLDLLDQIRDDYPKLRSIRKRDSQAFLHLLEERSGLLMRSGVQWQANQSQEKAIWEFRHLTFQEYLAALALNNGHYKGREASQSLAEQVGPLATPVRRQEIPSRAVEDYVEAVSDSWREALRLLVSVCKDDDVDAVLWSILQPGLGEEPERTQGPRAVLAAQCLADEPNVGEDTAREVLQRFVGLIGESDGLNLPRSTAEKVAKEVWGSHPDHRNALEACLLSAFADSVSPGRHCGAVLAQLLGSSQTLSPEELERVLELARADLGSRDETKAIRAALQVLELAYQRWTSSADGLEEPLLAWLGRGGACARAAAWALAWVSVGRPYQRDPVSQNRLEPPVLATEWENGPGWLPTKDQTGVLLEALAQADASDGEVKRHLLRLLGKAAQPSVFLPLLERVADPDASVREAARDALAWLANHLPASPPPEHLDALEGAMGAQLVRNASLPEAERCEGLVVVALFGRERVLREVLGDQGAPVALRRRAAEALGLVASRCGDGDQRRRLRLELETWLRSDALDLLVEDEDDWAEHDRRLPLLQGASRGLQLAASADLPRLGEHTTVETPMLTLTALSEDDGLRIRTEVVTPPIWKIPLPECPGAGPQELELVVVPGGDHLIGSPEGELGRDLYGSAEDGGASRHPEARRSVTLASFALARHPITQAQWRAVAALPEVGKALNPMPAIGKLPELWKRQAQSGGLPVRNVSWNDCQEWLKRLNRWLMDHWVESSRRGEPPVMALPSESQWEVACRAGTETPFHFGETLDASWANYIGFRYGEGRQGPFRGEVVVSGAFGLVNRWGLAEMHGQLWEWCADLRHEDLVGGALRAWGFMEDLDVERDANHEKARRLLRGGSWFNGPLNCRSAYRDSVHPANHDSFVGFRVCCLPPGPLLGP